jgi:MYXO-CTERM domain-containing protein
MELKSKILWSAAAALVCLPMTADAKQNYPGQLPNSAGVCATCHLSPGGGGARNAFGDDARGNKTDGVPDWQKLYNLDSDGDGYSNGVELGDPNGDWAPGGTPATGRLSEPGQFGSTPCGNGEIESLADGSMEECDGANLNGATCADVQGDEAATPTCTATCEVDYAPCDDGGNANNTNGGTNNNTNGGTNNTTGATNNEPGNTNNDPGGTNNDPGGTNNSNGGTNNDPGNTNNTNTGGGGGDGGGDDSTDDEGCTQAPMGEVPELPGVGLLGLLGLVAWRRRRAR